jgi:hypothetical protein
VFQTIVADRGVAFPSRREFQSRIPNATLLLAVTDFKSALWPTATLYSPVVFALSVSTPIAMLLVPFVFAIMADAPIAML